jgi:hypothetical protein
MLAGTLAVALCASLSAAAQSSGTEPAAAEAAPAAAAADQPKSRRERRREAEAAEQAAAATAAVQPAAATAAVAAEPAAETVEAKMICKNIKVVGTKISRRVCGTPEQWASVSERTSNDAQETMRQVREATSIVVTQPGSPTGGGFAPQ